MGCHEKFVGGKVENILRTRVSRVKSGLML
jgi:hypothetical protein